MILAFSQMYYVMNSSILDFCSTASVQPDCILQIKMKKISVGSYLVN